MRLATTHGKEFRGVFVRLVADSLELALDESPRRVGFAREIIRRLEVGH